MYFPARLPLWNLKLAALDFEYNCFRKRCLLLNLEPRKAYKAAAVSFLWWNNAFVWKLTISKLTRQYNYFKIWFADFKGKPWILVFMLCTTYTLVSTKGQWYGTPTFADYNCVILENLLLHLCPFLKRCLLGRFFLKFLVSICHSSCRISIETKLTLLTHFFISIISRQYHYTAEHSLHQT